MKILTSFSAFQQKSVQFFFLLQIITFFIGLILVLWYVGLTHRRAKTSNEIETIYPPVTYLIFGLFTQIVSLLCSIYLAIIAMNSIPIQLFNSRTIAILFLIATTALIIVTVYLIISRKDSPTTNEKFQPNYLMIRIIGNDLPGLHGKNQTYDNLKYTLENECPFENVDKMVILNRIVDKNKEKRLITLLNKHKIKYLRIPFESKNFLKLGQLHLTEDDINKTNLRSPLPHMQKIIKELNPFSHYLINNNGCRNFAKNYGKQKGYEWTFVLDSNSYFRKEDFENIVKNIKSNTRYIIIPQVRLADGQLTNDIIATDSKKIDKLPKKEPQVAFHANAEYEFQKHIPYGCGPKAEFITALGVPGIWKRYKDFNYKLLNMSSVKEYQRKLPAAKWIKAGKIIRLQRDNPNENVKTNWINRFKGIYQLYHQAKNRTNNVDNE